MSNLKGPIVGLIILPLLTMGMHQSAVEAEKGIHREFTGRRAGMQKLLASIGEALGPTGSLVVGFVLTAAMLVWLIIAIKQMRSAPKGSY